MTHDFDASTVSPVNRSHDQVLEVANEFTAVEARLVTTRNGIRLRIKSLRLHTSVDLDPLALESLTWQQPSIFSAFLSKPFGDLPSGD